MEKSDKWSIVDLLTECEHLSEKIETYVDRTRFFIEGTKSETQKKVQEEGVLPRLSILRLNLRSSFDKLVEISEHFEKENKVG